MQNKYRFSASLIVCGVICIVAAAALVAYHGRVGFKGSTYLEELGFFVGAALAAAGIGVAVCRRWRREKTATHLLVAGCPTARSSRNWARL